MWNSPVKVKEISVLRNQHNYVEFEIAGCPDSKAIITFSSGMVKKMFNNWSICQSGHGSAGLALY
jgi:hypothetical protein